MSAASSLFKIISLERCVVPLPKQIDVFKVWFTVVYIIYLDVAQKNSNEAAIVSLKSIFGT